MGREHFKQMYVDACKTDCRAMPLAMALWRDNHRQQRSDRLPPIWSKTPLYRLMVIARSLGPYDRDFTAGMQERLLDGRVVVRALHVDGSVRRVKDPTVFDFDDYVLKPQELYRLLPELGASTFRE